MRRHALFTEQGVSGGGGTNVTAGSSAVVSVVGAISALAPQTVTVKCQGSGGTTYDVSNVAIRLHDLG